MTDFQVRVSSFRRVTLTKSKGSKYGGTRVLLAGDASEKFVPRGAQRSREFVKSAGSRVTNTPKERIGTGDFAKHLLDDTGGVTQADNFARATRLLHSSVPKIATEIKVSKKRGLHQVFSGLVNSTLGGPRRLSGGSLVSRVPGTKKKELSLDEGGKRVSRGSGQKPGQSSLGRVGKADSPT